jgi:uncharacterized membrane protein
MLNQPGYRPWCWFDPSPSCGSVMASAQEDAFGFPNSPMRIVAFSVAALW